MITLPTFTPQRLISSLTEWARNVVNNHNSLARGEITAVYSSTAAPTTGTHNIGDFVRNSAPSVAGGGGSQYVVLGWVCTVSGTPGTWVACRTLTGT